MKATVLEREKSAGTDGLTDDAQVEHRSRIGDEGAA
jgi:hypothetical protein